MTARIERATSESSVLVELDLDGTGRTDISTTRAVLRPHAHRAGQALADRPHGQGDRRHPHRRAPHGRGRRDRDRRGAARGARRQARASRGSATPRCRWTRRSRRPSSTCPAARTWCTRGEPAGQEYHLIGGHFTGSLTRHVLESIAHHAAFSIHVRVLAGRDPHHIVEAQFKALARALRFAVAARPARGRHPVDEGRAVMRGRPPRRLRGPRRPLLAARRSGGGAVGRPRDHPGGRARTAGGGLCHRARSRSTWCRPPSVRSRRSATRGRPPTVPRRSRSCCGRSR